MKNARETRFAQSGTDGSKITPRRRVSLLMAAPARTIVNTERTSRSSPLLVLARYDDTVEKEIHCVDDLQSQPLNKTEITLTMPLISGQSRKRDSAQKHEVGAIVVRAYDRRFRQVTMPVPSSVPGNAGAHCPSSAPGVANKA